MRKTKKVDLTSNKVQLRRQKQMLLLMQRYATTVYDPLQFILPYIWNFYYRTMDSDDTNCDEFICHTNIAAFACMLFEAQKLPVTIIITGMAIVGMEPDFLKIVFPNKQTADV